MPDPEFGTDAWVESVISDPWMPHYDIREYTREVAAAALEWAAVEMTRCRDGEHPSKDRLLPAVRMATDHALTWWVDTLRAKAREIREDV